MTTIEAGREAPASAPEPATVPGSPRQQRLRAVGLLALAGICAACGLAYELVLIVVGGYITGSDIVTTSLTLGVALAAMGVGAQVAKPLARRPLAGFVAVELVLAVAGGTSAIGLYAAWGFLGLDTWAVLGVAALVGSLIGAEIPLLMELLQRVRRQRASDASADLSTADYVGALVGSAAFPLIAVPALGLLRAPLAIGAVNALAGGAALALGGERIGHGTRLAVGVTAVGLVGLTLAVPALEPSLQQQLYRDPVVHSERSAYQEIVLTDHDERGLRLFLDGDLQFTSIDEHRYHEALVHPAMAGGPHGEVLLLGAGDGLAAREVLRYDDVRSVTLVDLDAAVVRLARTDPRIVALNQRSLEDPRLEVVAADAFTWLRDTSRSFDVIVADLPDPDSLATAKLYSTEMYGLAARALTPRGRLVVQASSPWFAPGTFWSTVASIEAAGLDAVPYHVDVPSFGDWGFVLASATRPVLALDPAVGGALRFLDEDVLTASTIFPRDVARPSGVEPSSLSRPAAVMHAPHEWRAYD